MSDPPAEGAPDADGPDADGPDAIADDRRLTRTEREVEALLFAAGPLSTADLVERLAPDADVAHALAALAARYAGRGVELGCAAGRWRFATAPDLGHLMGALRETPRRLSRAALETLAVIAYHQPVTRAEIEAIRGVGLSRGTLDVLLELGWVRMRGRRRTPGRPVTFAATDTFLERYGLASFADLPGMAELKAAGLLSMDLPPGFALPVPGGATAEEDPLDGDEAPEFARDFVGGPGDDQTPVRNGGASLQTPPAAPSSGDR